ncbi:hypothetical protein ABB37_05957 [Leptomonas pyrrhocoris]|uniref:Uncharacterized protein n=1 Tax=Leptomonas pyrrhocoris TaxID=157538 RepID=A0A0M9FZ17_LEPPY|nr:hypothetical protein ABB37_05957 [Leptomonas pyrrhocoris]KPA78893.1 hypothetical protein ABB37_05957 [Leptomonas pyrrhocoris]|eukprot:XP_015657332.1 hypothetical protein ABB37_05957 [Leptomonas pyrrhocoris]
MLRRGPLPHGTPTPSATPAQVGGWSAPCAAGRSPWHACSIASNRRTQVAAPRSQPPPLPPPSTRTRSGALVPPRFRECRCVQPAVALSLHCCGRPSPRPHSPSRYPETDCDRCEWSAAVCFRPSEDSLLCPMRRRLSRA